MAIKKSTEIPPGFKITKCPPSDATPISLYQLRKTEEEELASENQAERAAEYHFERWITGERDE